MKKKCEETISSDWSAGSKACEKAMDYVDKVAGNVFTYDATSFEEDWNPFIYSVEEFLTSCGKKTELYKSIHVDQSTKNPIYSFLSEEVEKAYADEQMLDWSLWFDELTPYAPHYHILIYSGEFD